MNGVTGGPPCGPAWPARPRAAGLLLVLAAGAGLAWGTGVFARAPSPATGPQQSPAPATAPVTRQEIAATTPVTATLGYAGSWTVLGPGVGTLTWLPSAGQVIRQGQPLYETDDGTPVVLLYGSGPAWRSLGEGVTGPDVSQLNHDLVTLGYASRADIVAAGRDYYSWATASGVEELEAHLGVSAPAGSLPLGQVVFEPGALRVSRVTGSLGTLATGPVLTATSDRHVVTILLSTSQETQVSAGGRGDGHAAGRDDNAGHGLVGRHSGVRDGQRRVDPGAGDAHPPGGSRDPGPGPGDGEHHHREQPRPGPGRYR